MLIKSYIKFNEYNINEKINQELCLEEVQKLFKTF